METLQRTANRGSISTGFDIDNSLKLEADNSERLKSNNTHASSTPTSSKIGTFSFWVKRTELGANYMIVSGNSARYSRMFFNSSDQIQLYSGDSSWNSVQPITNAVFRDTSAWYHIVLRLDSTDSTAANRLRLYVNGEEQTWSTSPNITQDGVLTLCGFGSPTWHSWGSNLSYFSPSAYFSGYLAEVHYVDGQALAPTEFGEYDEDSGIWKPKEYDGTYGNCGYYLDFADSGNLGDDESGNGFDFDETNITSADQATDTPTNNFSTYNVLVNNNTTETEGATRINSDSSFQTVPASIGVTSGKWYAEFKHNEPSNEAFFGVVSLDGNNTDFGNHIGNDSDNYGVGMYAGNGNSYITGTIASFSSATSSSVVVGIALDMDNGYVYISKDGTWQNSGDPTSGSSGTGGLALAKYQTDIHAFAASCFNLASQYYVASNFGGYTTISISSAASDANGYGTFEYSPPSGYYALCTKNLAEFG
jgi:hypothetical protein